MEPILTEPLFYSLDIETLGVRLTAPIIEIGICAVTYCPNSKVLTYTTEQVTIPWHLKDSAIEPETLKFHLRQPGGPALLEATMRDTADVPLNYRPNGKVTAHFVELLGRFGIKKGEKTNASWYCRHPEFDSYMIRAAVGPHNTPWHHYNIFDQATVDRLFRNTVPKYEGVVTAHRAGDDAENQARRMVACLRYLDDNPMNWSI